MYNPINGDVLEVKHYHQAADQLAINVLHYYVSGLTDDGANGQELIDALSDQWAGLVNSLMSTAADYILAGFQRIDPMPLTDVVHSIFAPVPGLESGTLMPRQVSGIITKKTGFASRALRGRMYVGFMGIDQDTTAGHPTIGYIAELQSMADNLFGPALTIVGAAGSTTLKSVLWHRGSRTFDYLTSGLARSRWATQKRRGDYGRPNVAPFA